MIQAQTFRVQTGILLRFAAEVPSMIYPCQSGDEASKGWFILLADIAETA
jgi:hypothetical protein